MGRYKTKQRNFERDGEVHRYCSTCKKVLPIVNFNKNSGMPDGIDYKCKACRSKKYQKNKKWHAKFMKDYYERNKKEVRKQQKRYYDQNTEKVKGIVRRWQDNNKHRLAATLKMNYYKRKQELLALNLTEEIINQSPELKKKCQKYVIMESIKVRSKS